MNNEKKIFEIGQFTFKMRKREKRFSITSHKKKLKENWHTHVHNFIYML